MVYYKIPITNGVFDYPAGCLLCCAYPNGGYMYCQFEYISTPGSGWVQITASEFDSGKPIWPAPVLPPAQEVIATSAVLTNGNIVLDLPAAVATGTLVKFTAPCVCKSVAGGIVIGDDNYGIVDSMGNTVTGVENVWDAGAQVAVLIDTTAKMAYIQGTSPAVTPVSRGGTGASTAAKAREALGVTPENIGALPSTGGTLDGYFFPVRGKNMGTEDEIPDDFPDGALWLKVVG